MARISETEYAKTRILVLAMFAASVSVVVLAVIFFVTISQAVDAGGNPSTQVVPEPTTIIMPYAPPPTDYELGLQQVASGRYDDALVSFTRAIEAAPDKADLYARRGNIYLATNRLDQAAQDFEQAMQLTRQLARDGWLIYFNQGETARAAGRYDDAVHYYTVSIQLAPSNYVPYYERAEIYEQFGYAEHAAADYAQVIAILAGMIRSDPTNVELLRRRALIYQKMGDVSQALSDWLRITEITPDDPNAYRNVGLFYVRQQHYEQALPFFDYAIQLAPQNADLYGDTGWLYARLGNYDRALANYSHALTLDPSLFWRRLERADIYLKQHNYEQATADYTSLIDLNREQLQSNNSLAKVYNRRAWSYAVAGFYDQAVSDQWQALAVEPNGDTFFGPYFELGLDLQGERDELIGFYERILALDTSDGVVAQRLADLYAVRGQEHYFAGNLDAAISDFSRLKELEPLVNLMIQDADHALATAYTRRAQGHEQLGETADAIQDYLRAAEHGYFTAETVLRLGDLYFALHDRANALAYYEHYAQLGGYTPDYVLERLTQMRVQ